MASIPVIRSSAVLAPGYPVAAPARVRTRARVAPRAQVVPLLFFFLVTVYGAFSGASLAASVLTEKARQQGLNAAGRARMARTAEGALIAQVEELRSLRSIDHWATQNGFVAPYRAADPSGTKKDGPQTP